MPVIHGGERAFYSPTQDVITLPPIMSFFEEEGYWSTLRHELTHASGHPSRLDRTFGKRGSRAYAFEELVAELTSCFLGADLGISPAFEDSASYLDPWCVLLGDKPMAIFSAATQASKTAVYLHEQALARPVAA